MRFDLIDLRLFLAVVDAGSITHGAASVGLSLAAASERLRDMEAMGDVRLLDRGQRGVTPTAAGEALAHHARLIEQQVARMRGEIGEHAKGLRTTVRLQANTAAISEFLPPRLASWMAANPQADVELKERQSVEIAGSVRAGHAEIGILSSAVDATGLQLKPFAVDRLVVVASTDAGLAAPVRLADLAERPFIGLIDSALQDHIEGHARKMAVRFKLRAKLRSFDGLCQMAAAGVGVAIVPEAAATRCKKTLRLSVRPLAEAWATRQLCICIRSEDELAPPARSLVACLAAPSPT
ncbi:MAG TPA: LysR family transcriptional regulator [Burkholderiales bacterium]|nr:LysR family transcriptional regulator [Burkholderiales bacterium]